MKYIQLIACLFVMACGKATLADKVVIIAAALPIPADSAERFFAGIFDAGDSMQVKVDEPGFMRFKGKRYSIDMYNGDSLIDDVFIRPEDDSLALPLYALGAKMDSTWHDTPEGPFLRKDPPPSITAYYTDGQHRKKKIEIDGISEAYMAQDSTFRYIRISIPK